MRWRACSVLTLKTKRHHFKTVIPFHSLKMVVYTLDPIPHLRFSEATVLWLPPPRPTQAASTSSPVISVPKVTAVSYPTFLPSLQHLTQLVPCLFSPLLPPLLSGPSSLTCSVVRASPLAPLQISTVKTRNRQDCLCSKIQGACLLLHCVETLTQ